MTDKVKIAAILNVAGGALILVGAVGAFAVLSLAGGIAALSSEGQAAGVLALVAIALSTFLVLLALPGILGGWGLWRGERWARPLLLVLSCLNLLNFPFGSAIGAYTLWALLSAPAAASRHPDQQPPPDHASGQPL